MELKRASAADMRKHIEHVCRSITKDERAQTHLAEVEYDNRHHNRSSVRGGSGRRASTSGAVGSEAASSKRARGEGGSGGQAAMRQQTLAEVFGGPADARSSKGRRHAADDLWVEYLAVRARPFTDGGDPFLMKFVDLLWPGYKPPGAAKGTCCLHAAFVACATSFSSPPPPPADARTSKSVILPRVYRRITMEMERMLAGPGIKVTLNFDGWTGGATKLCLLCLRCCTVAVLWCWCCWVAGGPRTPHPLDLDAGCSAGARGESIIGVTAVASDRQAYVLGMLEASGDSHTADFLAGAAAAAMCMRWRSGPHPTCHRSVLLVGAVAQPLTAAPSHCRRVQDVCGQGGR